jgi:hypothetical protein
MSETLAPSPSGATQAHVAPVALKPSAAIDDMEDAPDDLARWPSLAPMLEVCAKVVEPAFRKADKAALRHQWIHRQLIKWATAFGTAAVIFAILQLAFADQVGLEAMSVPEVVAVILAFIAVGLGLRAAFQANWLVERNKAERLRLAKFKFLIDPDVWNGNPMVQAQKQEDLQTQVREVEDFGPAAVHHWIENDSVPDPPPQVLALTTTPAESSDLVEYYRVRRLQYQLAFFRKRADQNLKLHTFTKYLSPGLFLGSVGAVLIHFGYDILWKPEHLDTFSRCMILLAASLPVLGGAIRTFRSAYEFARNTYRYRAKAVVLMSIDSALEHATASRSQFLGMWFSEQTLETEHREWLRLMIEAEWFA